MIGKAAPPAAPTPGFQVFWTILGRLATEFMAGHGFGSIVIQVENGVVKRVHINQSFTPEQLPRI
jgi:hypothetical protein